MKLLFFIFFLIFLTVITFSQEKYIVYFNDKGIEQGETLAKTTAVYQQAMNSLTLRAIERRKKNMGDEIITYEDLPLRNDYINQLKSLRIEIVHQLTWFNAVSAYLNDEQLFKVKNLPFVKKVEGVKTFINKKEEINSSGGIINKISSPQGNLDYENSFGQLELIDVPEVHSKGINGQGIILGLLDSGFDWKDHESLINTNVIAEHDFVFNDSITANEPGDDPSQHNHGTSVMSEVAGFKDSTLIGASYGSSFLLAKTEDIRSETHVEEDNYAAALIWMENFGVDVTSSSLGYNEFNDSTFSYTYEDMDGQTTIVTKACELAFSRGVVTITSAGNEGALSWHYITAPADGFNTIAVGAVTSSDSVTSFSSRGPSYDGRIKPDIVTQGSGIYAASASGFSSYSSNFGGTSAAAPLALGVAGLLLSAHPYLTNVQVRDILLRTAANYSSPNNDRGYGLLSAKNAVNYPNFESVENSFKLHKIFINDVQIDPATVKLNYTLSGSEFQQVDMNFDGILRYDHHFTDLSNDQSIEFFFTYNDNSGNSYREPESGNYGGMVTNVVDFILNQNYPNPFNSSTEIDFTISETGIVNLKIYNVLGEEVKSLLNEFKAPGNYKINFDASELSSGVYFYKLETARFSQAKKMILLK